MRWTAARKISIIDTVRRLPDLVPTLLKTYGISLDELKEWERLYDEHGPNGLKTTALQKYRKKEERSKNEPPSSLPKHPPFRRT